ncbi:hypothetical protein VPHF99_0196 [Vibrio phage F99]
MQPLVATQVENWMNSGKPKSKDKAILSEAHRVRTCNDYLSLCG